MNNTLETLKNILVAAELEIITKEKAIELVKQTQSTLEKTK